MAFEKIKRVLIANRGEIAVRLTRCCKQHGLFSIAVYSPEDADSIHVSEADESVPLSGLGGSAYLDIKQMVTIAVARRADVVLPGYGFLSENSQFAKAIGDAGIVFAGPGFESIEMFGIKHIAREIAERNSVPVLSGTPLVESPQRAREMALEIGFPVMMKSTAGGGGMGLKVCWDENELESAFREVVSRGEVLFKNTGVFLEKYIQSGRHIEVQIFGNGQGDVLTFGERECSIQRRHQKVIEECPSPFVADNTELRRKICCCAADLASSANYKSVGTVEFLLDNTTSNFYFLEMNTRLQVEHGITELVYGVDLVFMMLLQAEYEAKGEVGIPSQDLKRLQGNCQPIGHAIEARLYAENPSKSFQPSPGILHLVDIYEKESPGCTTRVDHWIATGSKISPYFDPLLAKFMVWGDSREEARSVVNEVLARSSICGPATNKEYLIGILNSQEFITGHTLTTFLNKDFVFLPNLIEFIRPGAYTTVQDLPGRVGYSGGVPLGGAADPLHFQLANLIVGNSKNKEALEISVKGPKIKFYSPAIICLAGADFQFKVNNQQVPMFASLEVPAGSIVSIGTPFGTGARAYLAIKNGFPDIAPYLGSKSCTPTLSLGGHQGRIIMQGDFLGISRSPEFQTVKICAQLPAYSIPPKLSSEQEAWTIRTLSGPHDTPDICDVKKMDDFYRTDYKVNINSNRGCTKLDGQADVFSRTDGGDGGSHPSNILEYPYPTCGVSVIGNGMAMFGVDGGTLSGFTCIAVPLLCDWWKNGQAQIGAKIHFKPVTYKQALELNKCRKNFMEDIQKAFEMGTPFPKFPDPEVSKSFPAADEFKSLLYSRAQYGDSPQMNIRQAGEGMVLVDFGVREFDLVHCGYQRIIEELLDPYLNEEIIRVESCTAAVGVLFDSEITSRGIIVDKILKLVEDLPSPRELKIKSTLYRLPCTFEHSALDHCLERYMHSQRPYAAYLPSNAEYIMKANNLETVQDFKKMIIGQRQVVTAVSFFCGNTLTVNLDPSTRLLTGKYNPPRTFTPKGAIGSGSVGQSIYSIDCPGGFMVWAMTLPDLCWNTFSRLKTLKSGKPWFFTNFDQIEYYEVDETELNRLNNHLISGKLDIVTEEVELDFGKYKEFVEGNETTLQISKQNKKESVLRLAEEDMKSFEKWDHEVKQAAAMKKVDGEKVPLGDSGAIPVTGGMSANVFKVNVKSGDIIESQSDIVVLEAMKMEIHISAESLNEESDEEEDQLKHEGDMKYKVLDVVVSEGDVVGPSDTLVFIAPTRA